MEVPVVDQALVAAAVEMAFAAVDQLEGETVQGEQTGLRIKTKQ